MGSNTFPQQQSMGQMPQPMMQQQDQQTGFAGMYLPQYGSMAPSNGMQGYGGGQSVPNYTPNALQAPMVNQVPQVPMVEQAVPDYQVPQVQQQAVAGYGGYAQQPMQNNPYGVARANKTVLY
jgi:hypothetical protein